MICFTWLENEKKNEDLLKGFPTFTTLQSGKFCSAYVFKLQLQPRETNYNGDFTYFNQIKVRGQRQKEFNHWIMQTIWSLTESKISLSI